MGGEGEGAGGGGGGGTRTWPRAPVVPGVPPPLGGGGGYAKMLVKTSGRYLHRNSAAARPTEIQRSALLSSSLGKASPGCTREVLHIRRDFRANYRALCQGTHARFTDGNKKADSTLRCSHATPHPSTNWALRRLVSEVRRDLVHSTRYCRRRRI